MEFVFQLMTDFTKGDIHRYSMGEKDIIEKALESYSDVFADIINVLMFNGERIIREEELEERVPISVYKTDGKVHETERDVIKRWKKNELYLACIGLENQTTVDSDMPLRIMEYDGAEYRAQLLKGGQKERYPVVTLVLYFGLDRRWTYASELRKCLQIPEKLKSYVSDYKINLIEIPYLTDEQLDMFESDFRVIADYFVQMRKNGEYQPETREIRHVRETLHMLSVLTGDDRFEEVNNAEQRGVRTMCEVLDRIEKRGKEQGGRLKLISQIVKKVQRGKDIESIADALEESVDVICPIYEAVLSAPDLNVNQIYDKLFAITSAQ